MMEDEIIELTQSPKAEPWCSTCLGFTDYRRKWEGYPRSDLDGGCYSENIEIPHCIICGSAMHYLKACKQMVWGFRIISFLFFALSTLLCFVMFDLSSITLAIWLFSVLVVVLLCKLPASSRKALQSHSLNFEKNKLLKQRDWMR